MIEFTTGDILECQADALINTVNCVGVMGRGIALQFKNAYPANFKAYAVACERGEVVPGRMFFTETGRLTPPRFIINFPTKRHWRDKSRISDIEAGLRDLVEVIRAHAIRSVAVPPLGSGLGGLDWRDVRPRIERALACLSDVQVLVFEPGGKPATAPAPVPQASAPNMTPGRAALIMLMDRYLAGLLDPFVTLLEVHKLMYFMQEAGEPLRLKYVKAPYGPYAENLRHVLQHIEGHWLRSEADAGESPTKPLSLLPDAAKRAREVLIQHATSQAHCDRVTELVSGFESAFGLELLSTVHWVMNHEGAHEPEEVVRRVHAWNTHKRQFSPRQITLAMERLQAQGWTQPES